MNCLVRSLPPAAENCWLPSYTMGRCSFP